LTRKETLLTNHVTRFGGAPPGFSSRRPRVREDAYWKVRDERARGRLGGKTKGRRSELGQQARPIVAERSELGIGTGCPRHAAEGVVFERRRAREAVGHDSLSVGDRYGIGWLPQLAHSSSADVGRTPEGPTQRSPVHSQTRDPVSGRPCRATTVAPAATAMTKACRQATFVPREKRTGSAPSKSTDPRAASARRTADARPNLRGGRAAHARASRTCAISVSSEDDGKNPALTATAPRSVHRCTTRTDGRDGLAELLSSKRMSCSGMTSPPSRSTPAAGSSETERTPGHHRSPPRPSTTPVIVAAQCRSQGSAGCETRAGNHPSAPIASHWARALVPDCACGSFAPTMVTAWSMYSLDWTIHSPRGSTRWTGRRRTWACLPPPSRTPIGCWCPPSRCDRRARRGRSHGGASPGVVAARDLAHAGYLDNDKIETPDVPHVARRRGLLGRALDDAVAAVAAVDARKPTAIPPVAAGVGPRTAPGPPRQRGAPRIGASCSPWVAPDGVNGGEGASGCPYWRREGPVILSRCARSPHPGRR
jgi:hypothetical protein